MIKRVGVRDSMLFKIRLRLLKGILIRATGKTRVFELGYIIFPETDGANLKRARRLFVQSSIAAAGTRVHGLSIHRLQVRTD